MPLPINFHFFIFIADTMSGGAFNLCKDNLYISLNKYTNYYIRSPAMTLAMLDKFLAC